MVKLWPMACGLFSLDSDYKMGSRSPWENSFTTSGEAGSIAVLPPHCGPLSLGSIPSYAAVCPFGIQSKLASAGFLVFLLHLKLDC